MIGVTARSAASASAPPSSPPPLAFASSPSPHRPTPPPTALPQLQLRPLLHGLAAGLPPSYIRPPSRAPTALSVLLLLDHSPGRETAPADRRPERAGVCDEVVPSRAQIRGAEVDMQGGAADSPGGVAAAGNAPRPSRYESQKRRDWHTFGQYLRNHRPPLELGRCSGAHVLEFLRYLDQFGKTKVHAPGCPFFGHPSPPAPCPCPLRQAWGSLDALVGRLRAAFEEHGGRPEANPFGARAVRLYLREVRDSQAKARGIAYEKKRRKRPSSSKQAQQQSSTPPPHQAAAPASSPAMSDAAVDARAAHVPEAAGHLHHHHFFIPHPQFLHGFSLVPGNHHDPEAVASGNGSSSGSSAGGAGIGSGDELALALEAEAEAHAAGCLLPLSVFN